MEKSELRQCLEADLYRYGGARTRSYLWKALSPLLPAFRYSYLLRHASLHPKRSLRGFLLRALLVHYSCKYGFQIPVGTRIGKGLYIGHRGPVVINALAQIGDNCTLTNSVTIGQTNRGSRAGAPKIGDMVWIGVGAVVVGGITIGNNVLIAPNSYVNCDVPDNSVVTGNPAVVRPHPDATRGYINFPFPPQAEGEQASRQAGSLAPASGELDRMKREG